MEQEPGYLVRYGLMGHVGKFAHEPEMDFVLDRGQAVVIRTDRGEEVGEVLVPVGVPSFGGDRDDERAEARRQARRAGFLRPASAQDLEDARRSAQLRSERFQVCQRICGEQSWPLEVIDVEPLLDQKTTVVHYLGPRDLDLALLRAQIRRSCDFDIIFEHVGSDHENEWETEDLTPATKAAEVAEIAIARVASVEHASKTRPSTHTPRIRPRRRTDPAGVAARLIPAAAQAAESRSGKAANSKPAFESQHRSTGSETGICQCPTQSRGGSSSAGSSESRRQVWQGLEHRVDLDSHGVEQLVLLVPFLEPRVGVERVHELPCGTRQVRGIGPSGNAHHNRTRVVESTPGETPSSKPERTSLSAIRMASSVKPRVANCWAARTRGVEFLDPEQR